eukprot:gene13761-15201_t
MAARMLNNDTAGEAKKKSRSQPDLYKVSVEVTKTSPYTRSKTIDEELFELCELSGVKMSKDIFDIILDLLRLNVNPNTIVDVTKRMTSSSASTLVKDNSAKDLAGVPRYGSDNTKSNSKTKSNLSAVINDSKVPRAQSLY